MGATVTVGFGVEQERRARSFTGSGVLHGKVFVTMPAVTAAHMAVSLGSYVTAVITKAGNGVGT